MLPIIITKEQLDNIKTEIETLSEIVNKYHCRIHIRKKGCNLSDLDYFCNWLSESGDMSSFTLHGYPELVEKYCFGGYHDKPCEIEKAKAMFGRELLYSTSCHSMEEADAMETDYLFLSPIFNSISKQGYNSPYDLQEVENWLNKRMSSTKIVALGGIDKNNARKAYEMGFDGVALLGAIWNGDNVIENYKKIYE